MAGFPDLDIDIRCFADLGDQLIPRLNALREHDPLFWSTASNCWIVTGNDLVTEGFSGRLPLSAKRHQMLPRFFPDPVERQRAIGYIMEVFPDFLVSTDPPQQLRLRKLLMAAFSKAAAERYRPRVRQIVAEVIGSLEGLDEIDFVAQVARPITARAILHVMGLSEIHLERLEDWAQAINTGLTGPDPQMMVSANRAMMEMRDVLLAEIERHGDRRGNDFLSLMLAARDGQDKLTRNEVVAQLILILIAGHDTTLNTTALSMAKLADMPAERAYVREHPERFEACIMELMRLVAMSTSQARVVSEDFEWSGRSLKAGQIVYLMIAAANRDPGKFAEPERIDFDRSQAANLTFAPGRHFCIGHWFAKMMMSEIFPAFLERYESWDLHEDHLTFGAATTFRGPLHLGMRLHAL